MFRGVTGKCLLEAPGYTDCGGIGHRTGIAIFLADEAQRKIGVLVRCINGAQLAEAGLLRHSAGAGGTRGAGKIQG